MLRVDLNADLGELGVEHDSRLMTAITSASIAAGFHAGDASTLRATIRLAKAHGVAVGAHPSFDDRASFGRREMAITPAQAEDLVTHQIAAVSGVAAAEGVRLQHVKPHGALYNMAARDIPLATAIARAVAACDGSLILFAPAGSELLRAGQAAGIRVAAEVFADRAYQPDGTLAARGIPGAVIEDAEAVITRALRMVINGAVVALDGSTLSLRADTICVHGDTAGADVLAVKLRSAFLASGVDVKAVGKP